MAFLAGAFYFERICLSDAASDDTAKAVNAEHRARNKNRDSDNSGAAAGTTRRAAGPHGPVTVTDGDHARRDQEWLSESATLPVRRRVEERVDHLRTMRTRRRRGAAHQPARPALAHAGAPDPPHWQNPAHRDGGPLVPERPRVDQLRPGAPRPQRQPETGLLGASGAGPP
jgi:hypothetical protein